MRRYYAFSLIEMLVVIVVVSILAGILLPVMGNARRKAQRVQCMTNQHQIALITTAYTNDHDGVLPQASRAWMELKIPPKALRCPEGDASSDNNYGFNGWISGRMMTEFDDTSRVVLLADSETDDHIITSWDDVARRHRDGALYAYADGHVTYHHGPHSIAYAAQDVLGQTSGLVSVSGTHDDDAPVVADAAFMHAIAGDNLAVCDLAGVQPPLGASAWVWRCYTRAYFAETGFAHRLAVVDAENKPIVQLDYGDDSGQQVYRWNTHDLMPPIDWSDDTGKRAERDNYFNAWRAMSITVVDGKALLEIGDHGDVLQEISPVMATAVLYQLPSPDRMGGDYTAWASPSWDRPSRVNLSWTLHAGVGDIGFSDMRYGVRPAR